MNSGHRKLCRSYNTPGEAHELTFSCFRRLPLLSKDRSRQWFVEALDGAWRRRDVLVWAHVIMPEHVHVIVLRASFSGLLLRTPFTGRPVVLPNDCRTLQWPTSSNPVHGAARRSSQRLPHPSGPYSSNPAHGASRRPSQRLPHPSVAYSTNPVPPSARPQFLAPPPPVAPSDVE